MYIPAYRFKRRQKRLLAFTCFLAVLLLCVKAYDGLVNFNSVFKRPETSGASRGKSAVPGWSTSDGRMGTSYGVPKVTISYCPHSGLTNQIYQLMTAMDIAQYMSAVWHSEVRLEVPNIVTERTYAPPCGTTALNDWCLNCGSQSLSHGLSWDVILDLNMLRLKTPYVVLGNETTTGSLVSRSVKTFGVCSLSHWCGLHLTEGHTDAKCHHMGTSTQLPRDRTLHMACLKRWLLQQSFSSTDEIVLRFGSIYGLVPRSMRQPRAISTGSIAYRGDLQRLSLSIVKFLRSHSATSEFWCAHLRVGKSKWDKDGAYQFTSRWNETASAYSTWRTSHTVDIGLLLTDNQDVVMQSTPRDLAGKYFFEGDITSEFISYFEKLSLQQILSVLQLTCAHASKHFLTSGSSFSAYINQLYEDSPMIHQVFHSRQGPDMFSS